MCMYLAIYSMKKLSIQSAQYQYLESDYRNWLDTLGYAEKTVYRSGNHLREFFHFVEQHHGQKLHKISEQHIDSYLQHLQERPNYLTDGGLSASSVNGHITNLNRFDRYSTISTPQAKRKKPSAAQASIRKPFQNGAGSTRQRESPKNNNAIKAPAKTADRPGKKYLLRFASTNQKIARVNKAPMICTDKRGDVKPHSSILGMM